MTGMDPAELAAAADRLLRRTNQLRAHGWGRPPVTAPYDRHDVYGFTLERAEHRGKGHPKYRTEQGHA